MDSPDTPLEPVLGDRLDSWKEIAAYLKRDVRTLHRWEIEESLPIHRHPHKKRDSVYAYRTELDVWRNERHRRLDRRGAILSDTGTSRWESLPGRLPKASGYD